MSLRNKAQETVKAIEEVQRSLSTVRPEDEICLISFGDVHLSQDPPSFRCVEEDWLGVQAGYLKQVKDIAKKYGVPIVCTGDIFDNGWKERKCPPALINFAIKHMPKCYAVAGNHDLPHHRIDQIERSGYWTLVEAGVIHHLNNNIPEQMIKNRWVTLYGTSYGESLFTATPEQVKSSDKGVIHVAVIHAYCWNVGHSFPGVSDDDHVAEWGIAIRPLNAAVFGDNHSGFVWKNICNGGTLMRRRSDEINYRPFVGLLTRKGEWRQHYLDTSKDKTLNPEGLPTVIVADRNFTEFLEELESLGDSALDFEEAVKQAMDRFKLPATVRQIVLRCMGGK